MKKLILLLTATATFNSALGYDFSTIEECKSAADTYENAYKETIHYKCKYYGDEITSTGAKKAAEAVVGNQINLNVYKRIFRLTCNAAGSLEKAKKEKNGKFSLRAFEEVFSYPCNRGYVVIENGAAKVAEAVAENRIDLNRYKEIFHESCSAPLALEKSAIQNIP